MIHHNEKARKFLIPLYAKSILGQLLYFAKKPEEAKCLIEEIKTISNMIRHGYFYEKAIMWDQYISK